MSSKLQQPSKLFYRIGEISRMTGLAPYVLRYWETEFPQIRPDKGSSGQRLYTNKDLEIISLVKQLLYKDGYTIAGARARINRKNSQNHVDAAIETVTKELRELIELLK